jgi:hypothetical protein
VVWITFWRGQKVTLNVIFITDCRRQSCRALRVRMACAVGTVNLNRGVICGRFGPLILMDVIASRPSPCQAFMTGVISAARCGASEHSGYAFR